VRQFLVDLGHKITAHSGDDRKRRFFFQHISVLLHHINSVLLHDSFVSVHCLDWWSLHSLFYISFLHTFGAFQGWKTNNSRTFVERHSDVASESLAEQVS